MTFYRSYTEMASRLKHKFVNETLKKNLIQISKQLNIKISFLMEIFNFNKFSKIEKSIMYLSVQACVGRGNSES